MYYFCCSEHMIWLIWQWGVCMYVCLWLTVFAMFQANKRAPSLFTSCHFTHLAKYPYDSNWVWTNNKQCSLTLVVHHKCLEYFIQFSVFRTNVVFFSSLSLSLPFSLSPIFNERFFLSSTTNGSNYPNTRNTSNNKSVDFSYFSSFVRD